MFFNNDVTIAVIGLGYVGLPLAVEFSKKYKTIGFDINQERIKELSSGNDSTLELTSDELRLAKSLIFTSSLEDIKLANTYIITVPTPIDVHRQPDLTPLVSASRTIGKVISKGDIVIYESTVYPGATEEVCLPEIEVISKLKFNVDFFAGYSPERINPGDKARPLRNIVKVTSGSTAEVAEFVDQLYRSIIDAGTFRAASIKVAEASKIIENTQRDVNIALINELSMIFDNLGIDTSDVIEAAATKWNFVKLLPGLVGGHCIGVDPYYLVHKSMSVGHIPDIIRTAREINDGMPQFVASKLIRHMIKNDFKVKGSRVLVMGFTFKENCPDVRNTKVNDLILELEKYDISVDVFDPWVNAEELFREYDVNFVSDLKEGIYDSVVIAVGHSCFLEMKEQVTKCGVENFVLFDMKNIFKDSNIKSVKL